MGSYCKQRMCYICHNVNSVSLVAHTVNNIVYNVEPSSVYCLQYTLINLMLFTAWTYQNTLFTAWTHQPYVVYSMDLSNTLFTVWTHQPHKVD
jgi:exonuclease III